ncbi:MFS transporter [Streptomyces longispororuber]|uniref:MFS transporter n=1 Tax=Streptomyces longispororuber TaxID=68230 RepID=UPI003702076F
MTAIVPRPPRGVLLRLYAFAGLNEFTPVLTLYPLLFTDHGLTSGDVSALFAVWSVTGLVLEVPSGVWADHVPRPWLLALGQLLRAVGFCVWGLVPGHPSFAAGIVLWAACDALTSGTWEAWVYDELAEHRSLHLYPRLIGRARAVGLLATVTGAAVAAPLYSLGHYALVGCCSAAACLAAAGAALSLPRTARVTVPLGPVGEPGSRHAATRTLRAGLRSIGDSPVLRHAVLLAAVLQGIWAVEEYMPLLFRAHGSATYEVPLLIVVLSVGKAVGGWLVDPLRDVRPTHLAALLAAASVLLCGGALTDHAVGVVPVAVCFAVLQCATLLAQVRLQPLVPDRVRATVPSLSRLGGQATAIVLYTSWAMGARWLPPAPLVALFGSVLLLIAAMTPRLLPSDPAGRAHAAPPRPR